MTTAKKFPTDQDERRRERDAYVTANPVAKAKKPSGEDDDEDER